MGIDKIRFARILESSLQFALRTLRPQMSTGHLCRLTGSILRKMH